MEAVLSIVAKSYLSVMRWDFWICNWQEKHKAQFECSLSTHENYTFYTFYTSGFFTSLPLAIETWYDLFRHRRQSGEKQSNNFYCEAVLNISGKRLK